MKLKRRNHAGRLGQGDKTRACYVFAPEVASF